MNKIDNKDIKYLMSIFHDTWTWHRRLRHANFMLMNDLYKNELVIGLPKHKFNKDKPYDACQKEKQSKSSFKLKNVVFTSRPLKLIHMDLFGPTRVASLGGMHYAYMCWLMITLFILRCVFLLIRMMPLKHLKVF